MRGRPARPVLPYAGYSEVHYTPYLPGAARRTPTLALCGVCAGCSCWARY